MCKQRRGSEVKIHSRVNKELIVLVSDLCEATLLCSHPSGHVSIFVCVYVHIRHLCGIVLEYMYCLAHFEMLKVAGAEQKDQTAFSATLQWRSSLGAEARHLSNKPLHLSLSSFILPLFPSDS